MLKITEYQDSKRLTSKKLNLYYDVTQGYRNVKGIELDLMIERDWVFKSLRGLT